MNREKLPEKAREKQKENKKFLNGPKTKALLRYLPQVHEEVFEQVDCLQCAGCCKSISPRFRTPDISRIAKHLRIKESALIEQYLRLDEDGDYVVQRSPCPFLGSDNYCSIYEARPGDCRNYPYTDSDVFFKRPSTTLQNTFVCPAAFLAVEKMKELADKVR